MTAAAAAAIIAAAFAFLTTEAARRAFDFDRGVVVSKGWGLSSSCSLPNWISGKFRSPKRIRLYPSLSRSIFEVSKWARIRLAASIRVVEVTYSRMTTFRAFARL